MRYRELLETSKYTKLQQYIHNLKPQGSGIVIATPMYPEGGEDFAKHYDAMTPIEQQKTHEKNNELYVFGEKYLKHNNKRYFKQSGVFGLPEKSFVIIDMSEKDAAMLGDMWNQTAVIYIYKSVDGIVLKMINTQNFSIDSLVKEYFTSENVVDYYSKIGNNKWIIPFFDPEKEWIAAYGDLSNAPRRKAGKNKGMVLSRDKAGNLLRAA